MAINVVDNPSIDIDTRAGVYPIHFMNEIRNIWNGYRICYYKNVDWEDARPFNPALLDEVSPEDVANGVWLKDEAANKKWHDLCDAVVEDAVKVFSKQKAIALKYGYGINNPYLTEEDDINAITEDVIRERVAEKVNNIVKATFNKDERMYVLEIFRFFNACKHITPKLRMGHESPFEHGIITYTLSKVSRSLTHQLVRCRIASYSQASQRYIGEDPEDIAIVIPKAIMMNDEALKTVLDYLNPLPDVITKLRSLGIKNEDIRCVYPNGMATSIQTTMNFRELKHFIQLRLESHAQDEIRHIAFDLWSIMCNVIPFLWTEIV